MPKKIGNTVFYDLAELSEETGVSLVTLRKYCVSGRLRAGKLGRSWYVTEENLRAYLGQEKTEAEGRLS